MKLIRDLYAVGRDARQPVFSYEFFTPKTEEGDRALFEKTLPALARLNPGFCSVTYGAGGSTREKTVQMVDRIQREFNLPAMAHLTCVGSTHEQIRELLAEAKKRGIHNILALRGDPPAGQTAFQQAAGGFAHAHELVTLARGVGGFCLGVAGFPEGHAECREGKLVDWRRLKEKIDCGADFVITQLFFDNAYFLEFRDHLVNRLEVSVPVIPGVIPILSGSQIKRFTALCGATLPEALLRRLAELGDDDAATAEFGIDFASRQCAALLREGAPGIHFYTLNKAAPIVRILDNLGIRS